jgi:hypothetical protein
MQIQPKQCTNLPIKLKHSTTRKTIILVLNAVEILKSHISPCILPAFPRRRQLQRFGRYNVLRKYDE